MGFTSTGKTLFNKRLNRQQLIEFMQMQIKCRVLMKACYSSHYWGRTFESMGHSVGLIPAQHVTPFVRGNKNDNNDTLAIFEASSRPFIRFVPVKTQAQQETLILHHLRERLLSNRIATSNQLRGLLTDFGIIFPLGHKGFNEKLIELCSDDSLSATLTWLIHGARAMVNHARKRQDALNQWVCQLRERKSFNCTAVATAHKLALIMWTLLQKNCYYTPQLMKVGV